MGLTVLAAAPTQALIARQTVKDRLGITDASQDALLDRLILDASSKIGRFLGRTELARQQYLETLPGVGRELLSLSRFPVDPDQVTVEVDAVAVTDFEVRQDRTGLLYREATWPLAGCRPGGEPRANVAVTYFGGWLVPDQVKTWASGLALVAGNWIRPTSPVLSPFLFEVTTPGTTAGAEPAWPATAGTTVPGGGTVVLTARRAVETPGAVSDYCYLAVRDAYQTLTREAALASRKLDGVEESYFVSAGDTPLPKMVEAGLSLWTFTG